MDDKLTTFIEHMMINGRDENLELECRFGKYNKLTSDIKPDVLFNIYKLYKSRSKSYTFIKDISLTDGIRKRTIVNDSKNYVKQLFDNPSKIQETITKYANEYNKLKEQSIYLTKEKIFKPIQNGLTKIDLVLEKSSSPVNNSPKFQKNKFRCSLKGVWDIDLTIILLEDCSTNNIGIFFEIEMEFNYKYVVHKKLTVHQIIEEFVEISNCILTNIHCSKTTQLDVALRYSIFNQVVTLERSYLPTLLNSLYSVTEKADGERVYIQIDNKKSVYRMNPSSIIRHRIPLIEKINIPIVDTLLDGEIISIKGKLYFLGFDAIFYNGIDCRKYNLEVRLNYLKKAVDLLNKVKSGIMFQVKTFYMNNVFVNVSKIWNNRDKLFPYHLDGLIFTPVRGAYQSNLPIYKWKEKHSIDVRILYNSKFDFTEFHANGMPYTKKGSNEVLNEYIDHKTGNIYYKSKVITNNQIYKQLNLVNNNGILGISGRLKDADNVENMSVIIEVEYDPIEKSWVYLRKRPDKEKPNAYKSIISVLDAISDNITIYELSKMKHIKSQYELVGSKDCYSSIGFNFIAPSIESPLCKFYTWSYNNILPKSETILILGCDICVLQSVMNNYNNILVMEPNCLSVYGTQKSEGYIGLKEFVETNGKSHNSITIVWGSLDLSKGLKSFTQSGQTEINSFIKKNKISEKNKLDTIFINSFADIIYIDNKINKETVSKSIQFMKSIAKCAIGLYMNGDQIIKYLQKKPCLLTKNKDLHPLYKIYLNHKNLNKYKIKDIFTIKQSDIKLVDIQRMSNSYISQYQPLLFNENIRNIFKIHDLTINECKSFTPLYQEYKKEYSNLNDYDYIIADITRYVKVTL